MGARIVPPGPRTVSQPNGTVESLENPPEPIPEQRRADTLVGAWFEHKGERIEVTRMLFKRASIPLDVEELATLFADQFGAG